jgi:hypothetical protein
MVANPEFTVTLSRFLQEDAEQMDRTAIANPAALANLADLTGAVLPEHAFKLRLLTEPEALLPANIRGNVPRSVAFCNRQPDTLVVTIDQLNDEQILTGAARALAHHPLWNPAVIRQERRLARIEKAAAGVLAAGLTTSFLAYRTHEQIVQYAGYGLFLLGTCTFAYTRSIYSPRERPLPKNIYAQDSPIILA